MPRRHRSFDAVVRAVEATLRRHRVDHVLVGAISVMAFGLFRTTAGVDVIADMRPDQLRPLAAELRHRGFAVSEDGLRDALADGGVCTIHDLRSPFRIELAPAKDAAAKHAIRVRRRVRWRGTSLPVATPEHTVVMKLKQGSERDLNDALGILVRQRGRLDLRRMRAFAKQQGAPAALRDLEREARALEERGRRRQGP